MMKIPETLSELFTKNRKIYRLKLKNNNNTAVLRNGSQDAKQENSELQDSAGVFSERRKKC